MLVWVGGGGKGFPSLELGYEKDEKKPVVYTL